MHKEKEITHIIKDPQALEEKLVATGAKFLSEKVLNREIYENDGDYFIRFSFEEEQGHTKKFFVLKSNSNKNSTDEIKDRTEIEFEISDEQYTGLKHSFELLGFKKTNTYKKHRKIYTLYNCECSIDTMDDKTYFEIEFINKSNYQRIYDIVKPFLT